MTLWSKQDITQVKGLLEKKKKNSLGRTYFKTNSHNEKTEELFRLTFGKLDKNY